MDTKTSQALDYFKKGDYKKSLSIFKTFKMGFTKEESKTIITAFEILSGKESFYKQLGVDTKKEVTEALNIIKNKYKLKGSIKEKITLDIEPGDIILTGKFKNKKVVVKDFGTDDKGQPTINGKPILKIRIQKLMKEMSEDELSGGLSDNKTLEDIARNHVQKTPPRSYSDDVNFGISLDQDNLFDEILNKLKTNLKIGIKVELEHTDDINVAKEIAKDHLIEDPEYYEKLKTIEPMKESQEKRKKDLLESLFKEKKNNLKSFLKEEIDYSNLENYVSDIQKKFMGFNDDLSNLNKKLGELKSGFWGNFSSEKVSKFQKLSEEIEEIISNIEKNIEKTSFKEDILKLLPNKEYIAAFDILDTARGSTKISLEMMPDYKSFNVYVNKQREDWTEDFIKKSKLKQIKGETYKLGKYKVTLITRG